MPRNFQWTAKVAILLFSVVTTLAAGRTTPKILLWGENWTQNSPVRSGERWLALQNDGVRSFLVSTTVVVTPRKEGVRPVMVTVLEGFRPRFLVKDIPALSPGPVRTVFDGLMPLIPMAVAHFQTPGSRFNDVSIQALPRESKRGRGTERGRMHAVILRSYANPRGQVTQTLVEYAEEWGHPPSLRWAGDLDRDGRIDLLLDAQTAEEKGSIYRLYLSSVAKKGELVGLAAELYDPAC